MWSSCFLSSSTLPYQKALESRTCTLSADVHNWNGWTRFCQWLGRSLKIWYGRITWTIRVKSRRRQFLRLYRSSLYDITSWWSFMSAWLFIQWVRWPFRGQVVFGSSDWPTFFISSLIQWVPGLFSWRAVYGTPRVMWFISVFFTLLHTWYFFQWTVHFLCQVFSF